MQVKLLTWQPHMYLKAEFHHGPIQIFSVWGAEISDKGDDFVAFNFNDDDQSREHTLGFLGGGNIGAYTRFVCLTPPSPPAPCADNYKECLHAPDHCCTDPAFGCYKRSGRHFAMCRPLVGDCHDGTWLCPGWWIPHSPTPLQVPAPLHPPWSALQQPRESPTPLQPPNEPPQLLRSPRLPIAPRGAATRTPLPSPQLQPSPLKPALNTKTARGLSAWLVVLGLAVLLVMLRRKRLLRRNDSNEPNNPNKPNDPNDLNDPKQPRDDGVQSTPLGGCKAQGTGRGISKQSPSKRTPEDKISLLQGDDESADTPRLASTSPRDRPDAMAVAPEEDDRLRPDALGLHASPVSDAEVRPVLSFVSQVQVYRP